VLRDVSIVIKMGLRSKQGQGSMPI
jgi:hypothetical protein